MIRSKKANSFIIILCVLLFNCNYHKNNKCDSIINIRNKYLSFRKDDNKYSNDGKLIYKFSDSSNNIYCVDINNRYYIYGTLNNEYFGHYFRADVNLCIIKYAFNLDAKCNDYELIKKSNQWQFNGDPFVAKFTDYENNRVEFLISTYLVKIKNLKYSYDGKKYEELKMKEADFMPYLSIAELKDCFDKKIYFKLEVKKTDVNIKNYPSIFYDTVYLSSK